MRDTRPSLACFASTMAVWAIGVITGCAPYHTKASLHNGGDTPPLIVPERVKAGEAPELQSGDAIAVAHGNVDVVLISNPVTVDLMVPGTSYPSKSQAKAQGPSKSERKAHGQSKSEAKAQQGESKSEQKAKQPSKSERKAQQQTSKAEQKENAPSKAERKAAEPSKAERKAAEPSKAERKQDRPLLSMLKRVRLPSEAGDRNSGEYYHRGLKAGEDPSTIVFRLGVWNGGTADFHGRIELSDHFPDELKFVRTARIARMETNHLKQVLQAIPYLNLVALFLADYSLETISGPSVEFQEHLQGSEVKYDLSNVSIATNTGVVVDFEVALPDWWVHAARQ